MSRVVEAGLWKIQSAAGADEHGDEIVRLAYNGVSGAEIYGMTEDLPQLLAALMTYLDVDRIESTP